VTRAREESGLETAASARERARAGGESRSAPTPEALLAARAPSTRAVSPAGVLALQRSAGNRAVARRLGPVADRGERRLARQRRTVRQAMHEAGVAGQPDVAWTASYDVEFTDDECVVTIFARIDRDADVTEAQERTVRRQTRGAFARIWDNRFELEDLDTAEVFPVRVKLEFVRQRPHLTLQLHSGGGTDNLQNWFVDSSAIDRAHELGHQLGMFDEYVDPNVANRATAASPGVRTDHSIMGNYPVEGVARARAKLRHGRRLAWNIGETTGRRLRARLRSAAPAPAGR
jgi:hypothetical protein